MKQHLLKSLKLFILPGLLVVCMVIFSACHHDLYPAKTKVKVLDWRISFKENTTELQKVNAIAALTEYVIKELNLVGIDPCAFTALQIVDARPAASPNNAPNALATAQQQVHFQVIINPCSFYKPAPPTVVISKGPIKHPPLREQLSILSIDDVEEK